MRTENNSTYTQNKKHTHNKKTKTITHARTYKQHSQENNKHIQKTTRIKIIKQIKK